MIWNRSDMHVTSGEIPRRACSSVKSCARVWRWLTQAQLTRSESLKHDDVLGREYLGVSGRYLREEGDLACVCFVSALVIQPVLLRSVFGQFVHVTGCGKHLS